MQFSGIKTNMGEYPTGSFSFSMTEACSRALFFVLYERARQIREGYDSENDDLNNDEQLAALATALVAPRSLGTEEIVVRSDLGLHVTTIDKLAMESGPRQVHRRQVGCELGTDSLHGLTPGAQLHQRIDDLSRGLAVGLAELERLLRLREARAS